LKEKNEAISPETDFREEERKIVTCRLNTKRKLHVTYNCE